MRLIIFTLFLLFLICNASGQDHYEDQINGLLEKGYAHYGVQKDSGQFYFKKIESLASDKSDTLTLLDILITSNRHLGYFFDLQAIGKNLKKIDGLASQQSHFWRNLKDTLLYRNSILYDKGNYHFKLGNERKARMYFQKIRKSYQNRLPETLAPDHFLLFSSTLSFLAKAYESEDKFDLAKDYYLRNISLLQKVTPEDHYALNLNYALLAEVLTAQGKFDRANTYLSKTLADAVLQNDNPNRIVSVANSLAENHMALSQMDSARHYLSVMAAHLERSAHFRELYHRTKAKLAQKNHDTAVALGEIDAALSSYLDRPEQHNTETLANIHLEKARILIRADQPEYALEATDKGLDALSAQFGTTYLELMALKSESLLHLQKFHEAGTTALSAVGMLDSLKADYRYTSDKINLVEKAFPLFEAALECDYSLFKKTGDTGYVDKAFFFMEKSKSVTLLEALFASKADRFAGVPDSLLEKERSLGAELTALKKGLQKNTVAISDVQDVIFELNEQRTTLIQSISEDFPQYYGLRYNTAVVNSDHLTEELDDDEMLISYFYGNRAIYVISLDQETKNMLKIPLDKSLEKAIRDVYRMLADPKSDLDTLARESHGLFALLLQPLLGNTYKRRLTIVPDGLLNYIPFAALNIGGEESGYLAERWAVGYAHSATLLLELRRRQNENNEVLAFAPSFDGTVDVSPDRSKLSPLPHNKKEVAAVTGSMDGHSYLDREATLKNFRAEYHKFGVVHLATHAIFDDTLPEYSYLAFAQNDTEGDTDVLFTADLYDLKIDANLVTLSACETGLGTLKRGEGFLSLARGFFYSGASSLASTLWKVNDASSARLMGDFYKNLAEGETKDVALQKAQMAFLDANSQNALVHPYYWSGFVISGNTDALSVPMFGIWAIFFIAATVIGIAIVFDFRRKKSGYSISSSSF